jgi:hypothetical protein
MLFKYMIENDQKLILFEDLLIFSCELKLQLALPKQTMGVANTEWVLSTMCIESN